MSAQSTKVRFLVKAVASFVVLGHTILILSFCITLLTKVIIVKSMDHTVRAMYRCECWTIKKAEC